MGKYNKLPLVVARVPRPRVPLVPAAPPTARPDVRIPWLAVQAEKFERGVRTRGSYGVSLQ